ncbi:MAG: hypothetical protein PUC27_03220 [Clostridium sp.]|nr:hypothetical protein [Clostridium sp.]
MDFLLLIIIRKQRFVNFTNKKYIDNWRKKGLTEGGSSGIIAHAVKNCKN